jgi:ribosomal protein S18 acetylase RimI-like enzyme
MRSTELRSARTARPDELLELTHGVRTELLHRAEFLPASWVEEAATDLLAGRLVGWVLPVGEPAGLAFYSRRPHRAYAHVHLDPGPDGVDRARRLLAHVWASLPAEIEKADAGVTGLTESEETELAAIVRRWSGTTTLERLDMERRTAPMVPVPAEPDGPERRVPIAEIPLAALAQLDWAAFHGTPDESLIADTIEDDQRILSDIVAGHLGRFLPEASMALVDAEDHLVGALLTAEQSPRRAVFLDLVVHPAARRRGLGSRLVRFGLRAASALGYGQVGLWVTASNEPARALYDAHGFRPERRAVIYRFNRATAATASVRPQPQDAA